MRQSKLFEEMTSIPVEAPGYSLDEYQRDAIALDISSKHGVPYYALGVAGEAGEVAEKAKKLLRDDDGVLTEERREAMLKELGDVIWYVSVLAAKLGYKFSEVGHSNITKLRERQANGKLRGDGDNR